MHYNTYDQNLSNFNFKTTQLDTLEKILLIAQEIGYKHVVSLVVLVVHFLNLKIIEFTFKI